MVICVLQLLLCCKVGGGGVKERGEALVSSAERGEKELVARLLATRTTGMYRTRALVGASSYGHYDVVWLMCQAGVTVNGALQDGTTALMSRTHICKKGGVVSKGSKALFIPER